MAKILTVEGRSYVRSIDDVASFSPDNSLFVVRTRRGDLERDLNVEMILLWRTRDIEAVLNNGTENIPPPKSKPTGMIGTKSRIFNGLVLTILVLLRKGKTRRCKLFCSD